MPIQQLTMEAAEMSKLQDGYEATNVIAFPAARTLERSVPNALRAPDTIKSGDTPRAIPQAAEFGSGWYHDAAIETALEQMS
jgi:hypothetical protein